MKKAWYTVKLLINLIKISWNPKDTASGLAIAVSLLKLGLVRNEVQKIDSTSEGREFIQSRKLVSKINLLELQTFPEGSLAREYSNRMLKENLTPDFYEALEIDSDETYVMMNLRQSHDLWHTITGFGTSIPEELGLQAFMMAQVHSPLAPILIGSQIALSALKNPAESRDIVNQVARGWHMGTSAKSIFTLDWEKNWNTDLGELRRAYGI